jgi:hypothetical protein
MPGLQIVGLGSAVIHFQFNFSLESPAAHAKSQICGRNDEAINHICYVGKRMFFGNMLQGCDEVAHAAEPVKFDNPRKSAQR